MATDINPAPTLVSFEEALAVVKEVVATDPFRMEPYRKMAFWARIGHLAAANGKSDRYNHAREEFASLFNDPRRPPDFTGTMDALAKVFVDADAKAAAA